MAGSHRIQYLIQNKEKLYSFSLKFAKYDSPDFIIMKEAILAYAKIIRYQIEKTSVAEGALGVKNRLSSNTRNKIIRYVAETEIPSKCLIEIIHQNCTSKCGLEENNVCSKHWVGVICRCRYCKCHLHCYWIITYRTTDKTLRNNSSIYSRL